MEYFLESFTGLLPSTRHFLHLLKKKKVEEVIFRESLNADWKVERHLEVM